MSHSLPSPILPPRHSDAENRTVRIGRMGDERDEGIPHANLVSEVVRHLDDRAAEQRMILTGWIRAAIPRCADKRGISMALVYVSRPNAPST